jgi:hypothetical protein
MNFTYVNKNLLIPEVVLYQELSLAIGKLYGVSNNMSKNYCNNVYVVNNTNNNIFFINNNICFQLNSRDKSVCEFDNYSNSIECLEIIKNFVIEKSSQNMDMDLIINKKIINNIIIQDNNIEQGTNNTNIGTVVTPSGVTPSGVTPSVVTPSVVTPSGVTPSVVTPSEVIQPIEKSNTKPSRFKQIQVSEKKLTKEEDHLVKICEEVMEMYQLEQQKIKNLEMKLKVLTTKEKQLIKRKKDKILNNFAKMKGDYHTYKLIVQKSIKSINQNDFVVPALFALKYSYFNKLVKSKENVYLLDQMDDLVLDIVINNDIIIDDSIAKLANTYELDSKKLNVKFDHSWEDLEAEAESIDNNNSLFG